MKGTLRFEGSIIKLQKYEVVLINIVIVLKSTLSRHKDKEMNAKMR